MGKYEVRRLLGKQGRGVTMTKEHGTYAWNLHRINLTKNVNEVHNKRNVEQFIDAV